MQPLILIIIGLNALVTYLGLTNFSIFEKYKFNVQSVRRGEYVRLISSGFLHADWTHFFFNMLSMYFFGPMVLVFFGPLFFLLIYLGSIIAGNLFCQYVYRHKPYYSAIGASGGVSGLIFAAVALDPSGVSINFLPGYIFGALYFGYSVYMMLKPRAGDMIGHAAHLGGAVFGIVVVAILIPKLMIQNAPYISIMSLPLLYLAYEIFGKKRLL